MSSQRALSLTRRSILAQGSGIATVVAARGQYESERASAKLWMEWWKTSEDTPKR